MIENWKRARSRSRVVVALAVGVALFASTPAQAGRSEDWGTIQLTNTGAEPEASGQASLTNVKFEGFGDWTLCYSGQLSVKCKNLTPGARYSTPAGTFTANRKGNGLVNGKVFITVGWYDDGWFGPQVTEPYVVDVVRLNADGSSTTVLTGDYVPPGW